MLRYFLDTNVLLNGCFLSGEEAAAVSWLGGQGTPLLTDEWALGDATGRLRKAALKLALRFDPVVELEKYIARAKIIILPPFQPELIGKVHKSDRWIVAAARASGATLLSSDAPLALECRRERLPYSLASEIVRALDPDTPLVQQGHGVELPPRQPGAAGMLFFEVMSGAWDTVPQRFTFGHWDGVRLYYDGPQRAFVLETGGRAQLTLPSQLGRDEVWRAAFAWRGAAGGQLGRYALYASGPDAVAVQRSRQVATKRPPLGGGRFQLGATHGSEDYLNGHLRLVLMSGVFLTFDAFKNAAALGVPPPIRHGGELEEALAALDAQLVQLPA